VPFWEEVIEYENVLKIRHVAELVEGDKYTGYPTQIGIPANKVNGVLEIPIFAGGDGSFENPYLVHNARAFQALALEPYVSDINHYIQVADIDLGTLEDFKMIYKLRGSYDGDGYKLYNRIQTCEADGADDKNYPSLIKNNYGDIKNVVIEDFAIKTRFEGGMLVQINFDGAKIKNCRVTNSSLINHVRASVSFGNTGIAAKNGGLISNCQVVGLIIESLSNFYSLEYAPAGIASKNAIKGDLKGIIKNCFVGATKIYQVASPRYKAKEICYSNEGTLENNHHWDVELLETLE